MSIVRFCYQCDFSLLRQRWSDSMESVTLPIPHTHVIARGWDHLGAIRAKLADLGGYATLAYELIHNANDARKHEGDLRMLCYAEGVISREARG